MLLISLSALMAVAEEDADAATEKQPQDTKNNSGLKHRSGKNKRR